MSTDTSGVAAAIAARGVIIPIATGETVRLRYSMLSIEQLESRFGDLSGIIDHVEGAASAMLAKERARAGTPADGDAELLTKSTGAIFTELTAVLLPGLLDERATDPRTGELVWLEQRPDVAKRVLEVGYLKEYLEAFRTAFAQAFDTGEIGSGPADPPVPALHAVPASPGPIGTTSPAAPPAAPTPISGT